MYMQERGEVYLESGFWKLRWRQDPSDADGHVEQHLRKPVWIGPAAGPERLTREEAEQFVWESLIPHPRQNAQAQQSAMTVIEFVEKIFAPEHVAKKHVAGRMHYHALLKHILGPAEADRVFRVDAEKSMTKLEAVPGWPYLGHLRLCDVKSDDVQQLVAAASAGGYSAQTVKHIRNVVSTIFEHAKRKRWFNTDNPAGQVTLPRMTRKEAHALTLIQAKAVLGALEYPEREMALIAMLTSMNVAEICGLQWKCVNLTEAWSGADDEPFLPGPSPSGGSFAAVACLA